MFGQVARYLCVGIGGNFFVLSIYYYATLVEEFYPTSALTVASGMGFVVSYALQRIWSFRYSGSVVSPFAKYSLGYLGSFAVQWIILRIGVDALGLPHYWMVLFGLGVATVGFFMLQRYWVFAESESGPQLVTKRK
ncbi:GtrA family protein [Microvirga sp. BSC39]|uniref:GtrA family protein n=1 Tax=Microvirga sp. BSC39 TaxID=1549810 RepID=UPI0004E8A83B|nr:GtrA family protein [Microvirga sp. BSC39]KFG69885.1 hypothetical protein JH26_08475 [Microvirga sp. BSC39]